MILNIIKTKIYFLIFFLFIFTSCNGIASNNITILGKDSTLIGKYRTEYIIHYNANYNVTKEIYSDKEIYTCAFQGTNFLLEKDNPEEILSTTAPIQIIKSEIVK
jgi:hypothetical protein